MPDILRLPENTLVRERNVLEGLQEGEAQFIAGAVKDYINGLLSISRSVRLK